MKNKLVSAIITTKNEEINIVNCLESLKRQVYTPIEIVVVDNHSTDKTIQLAKSYTRYIYTKGPERSAQRNYGVVKAQGEYICFLDADMILSEQVITDCVAAISKKNVEGVIIPEESVGESFWARCKAFERSFYHDVPVLAAARFYRKHVFQEMSGFDETLTGPEDWDFSQRIEGKYKLRKIKSLIYHNEGNLSLIETIKKKYYYSKKFAAYVAKKQNTDAAHNQFNIFYRYWIFFKHPIKLLSHPLIASSMLFMKTLEFLAGAIGMHQGERKL